jgi:hypothetical protein
MGIYTRSKTAYDGLAEVLNLPSQRTLLRVKKNVKISSGFNLDIFVKARAALGLKNGEYVDILLSTDEMKVKSGLIVNVSSNTVSGIVTENEDSFHDIGDILYKCTSDDDAEKNIIAGSVSQWLLKAIIDGKKFSFPLNFWFSHTACSGDELRSQFFGLLYNCELFAFRVCLLVLDAGGGNSRLQTLLTGVSRSTINSSITTILSKDQVSMIHPLYADRRIFIVFCMVHGFKALRNQLYGTRPHDNKEPVFRNGRNGLPIRWGVLRDQHDRDNQLRDSPRTKHTKDSLRLDTFSKMRVHLVIATFHQDNCSEIIDHVISTINRVRKERGILVDEITSDQIRPSKNELQNLFSIGTKDSNTQGRSNLKIGYDMSRIRKLMNLVDNDWPSIIGKDNPLPTAEFLAAGNDLYTNLFTNSHLSITPDNFKEIKKAVESILCDYYLAWQNYSIQWRNNHNMKSGTNTQFLHSTTWGNMRISFSAAIHFCEYMFERGITSIPMTFFNQSYVEAWFSRQRSVNCMPVTPALYQSNFASNTINMGHLPAKSQYERAHVGDETSGNALVVMFKDGSNYLAEKKKMEKFVKMLMMQRFTTIQSDHRDDHDDSECFAQSEPAASEETIEGFNALKDNDDGDDSFSVESVNANAEADILVLNNLIAASESMNEYTENDSDSDDGDIDEGIDEHLVFDSDLDSSTEENHETMQLGPLSEEIRNLIQCSGSMTNLFFRDPHIFDYATTPTDSEPLTALQQWLHCVLCFDITERALIEKSFGCLLNDMVAIAESWLKRKQKASLSDLFWAFSKARLKMYTTDIVVVSGLGEHAQLIVKHAQFIVYRVFSSFQSIVRRSIITALVKPLQYVNTLNLVWAASDYAN